MGSLVLRLLGFTTAGSVVVEDLCIFLMLEFGVLGSVGPTLLMITVSRAGLIALGAK